MKLFHVLFPRFLPPAIRTRREIALAEQDLAEAMENDFRCDIRDARARLAMLRARLDLQLMASRALQVAAPSDLQVDAGERDRDVA